VLMQATEVPTISTQCVATDNVLCSKFNFRRRVDQITVENQVDLDDLLRMYYAVYVQRVENDSTLFENLQKKPMFQDPKVKGKKGFFQDAYGTLAGDYTHMFYEEVHSYPKTPYNYPEHILNLMELLKAVALRLRDTVRQCLQEQC